MVIMKTLKNTNYHKSAKINPKNPPNIDESNPADAAPSGFLVGIQCSISSQQQTLRHNSQIKKLIFHRYRGERLGGGWEGAQIRIRSKSLFSKIGQIQKSVQICTRKLRSKSYFETLEPDPHCY